MDYIYNINNIHRDRDINNIKKKNITPKENINKESNKKKEKNKNIYKRENKKEYIGEKVLQHDEIRKVIQKYNEICVSLPKVRSITNARKLRIQKLLRDYGFEAIIDVFKKAEESDFLSGRNGRWQNCGFDWLIKENNFIKVMEGTYDNRDKKPRTYRSYQELYEDQSEAGEKARKKFEEIYYDAMNAGADSTDALKLAEAIILDNGKNDRQQALEMYKLIKKGLSYEEAREKVSKMP